MDAWTPPREDGRSERERETDRPYNAFLSMLQFRGRQDDFIKREKHSLAVFYMPSSFIFNKTPFIVILNL